MTRGKQNKIEPVGGDDLWKVLGFSEGESVSLRIRADLFGRLQDALRASGKTQTALARALGTDQPKVSKILKGKMGEFSTDRIIEHLERMGVRVGVTTSPVPEQPKPRPVRVRIPLVEPREKISSKKPRQLVPAATSANKTRAN